jgi:hypothetical protein
MARTRPSPRTDDDELEVDLSKVERLSVGVSLLTGREKVDAASKGAYIEEALRINKELRLLTEGTLTNEPMMRKEAIGVLAKKYGFKTDGAFSKWLRRGLLARKKYGRVTPNWVWVFSEKESAARLADIIGSASTVRLL